MILVTNLQRKKRGVANHKLKYLEYLKIIIAELPKDRQAEFHTNTNI